MKNSKLRRAMLLLVCAVLLAGLSVGATMAYLTGNDAVKDTFTVGGVQITLDEAKVTPDDPFFSDDDQRVQGNAYQLLPGCVYPQEPVVTVKAGSTDCYLYAEIVTEGSVEGVLEYAVRAEWMPLADVTGPHGGQVYAWKEIIPAAKKDTVKYILAAQGDYANGGVKIADTLTAEMTAAEDFAAPVLTFYAYAIQSAHTGTAQEAWMKLQAQDALLP